MSIENQKTVVLWYLEGCIATFYELQDDKKKVPIDTVCFRDKAYLAFRQVDILVRILKGLIGHASKNTIENSFTSCTVSKKLDVTSSTE